MTAQVRLKLGNMDRLMDIPRVRITTIIQTYNAAEGLRQTLESLKGKVDRTLILDGYFTMKGTPHYHPPKQGTGASTDNSSMIAKQYGAEWIPADREYAEQKDKLNRIPELVPHGEWIFIIDTDEVLVSYVKDGLHAVVGWFDKNADMVMMRLEEPFYQHPFTGEYGRHRFYARLIRVMPKMHWENEACIVHPGRINLYAGTFPQTVYLRHLRRDA